MNLNELVEAVERAPDDILVMARRNCHARHVDSIVLEKGKGGELTRVFLAWPEHGLYRNHGHAPHGYEVGVHDHRYGLRLRRICGIVTNRKFELGVGLMHTEWRFTSGVANGSPKAEKVGECRLWNRWVEQLQDAWDTKMGAEELHTVEVPQGVPAAWLVREGPVERTTTRLFTTTPLVETAGLYEKFDGPEDVRQRVSQFASLAKKANGWNMCSKHGVEWHSGLPPFCPACKDDRIEQLGGKA